MEVHEHGLLNSFFLHAGFIYKQAPGSILASLFSMSKNEIFGRQRASQDFPKWTC